MKVTPVHSLPPGKVTEQYQENYELWQLTVAVYEPRGVDIFASDGLELSKLQ
jgi:hypothetical protein